MSLWYNAPTMLPAGHQSAISWVHYTTSCKTHSSAPEDVQNNYPKHVVLTGIINKLLLLHLVGCLYRVSQELRSLFLELIPELILIQKLHIHMDPIRNGSGVMNF